MWGQGSRESCYTWGLEVERDHLATGVPEDLRHVITGIHAAPFGVDTAHLTFVVAVEMLRIFIFLTMRFKACVLSCVHLSSTHTAGLFLVWTAWDNSPTGDGQKPWPHTSVARQPLDRLKQQSGSKHGWKSTARNVTHHLNHLERQMRGYYGRLKISQMSLTGRDYLSNSTVCRNALLCTFLGPSSRQGSQSSSAIWREHFGSFHKMVVTHLKTVPHAIFSGSP